MSSTADLERHWPLVLYVAKSLSKTCRHWTAAELASFGYDGLRSAHARYDPSKGPFHRYAYYRIKGAMFDAMGSRRWRMLAESAVDINSLGYEPRTTEGLYDLLKGLKERERYVLCLYYRDGWNLREIGASMGLTESATCVIAKKALAKIRARLLRESSLP